MMVEYFPEPFIAVVISNNSLHMHGRYHADSCLVSKIQSAQHLAKEWKAVGQIQIKEILHVGINNSFLYIKCYLFQSI